MNRIPEEWYGHEPTVRVVTLYECEECGRDITQEMIEGKEVWVHEYRVTDMSEFGKQQYRQKGAALKAAAVPYKGAITHCQVGLTTRDRAATHYRCDKPARFVGQDYHGKPMVVCGIHARQAQNFRYRGRDYPKGAGADEPLEEEYL